LFAAAFFVVQRLTFTLRFAPYHRTTIWTPGSLLFTALLLVPPRRWWVYYVGLCVGAFAAFYGDDSVPEVSVLTGAQLHFAAVAFGVWLVRRFGAGPPLESTASLLAFVPVAVVVVPLFTIGPDALVQQYAGRSNVWSLLLRSMFAGSLGVLIATPALTLTLANGRDWLRTATTRRAAELACLTVALAAVGYFCFEWPAGESASPVLLCAPLPLLLWAAMRFGLAGVSWALLVMAFQSTRGAVHGNGPFTGRQPAETVLQVQFFLFAVSLPLMFLATVIDERRRTLVSLAEREREVRSQFAQLATIYNAAPVGLAFVDLDLRFVSVNDCLAELNGLPAAAHLGRTIREVLPALADAAERVYRRVIATGRPVTDVEVHGTTLALPGSERCWLVSHYPVQVAGGATLGVSTVVQEITERKRTEEARQELAHASRLALVGELTASIAHEINQPLGAILSNADAAEMLLEASPVALDEVRQILDDIRRDDLRASEVIHRLRVLLRKREVELQPLDLNDLVQEVLSLVRTESRRRGVTIETRLADGLPLVRGDKVHLQQVLINLVLNGMEAMASVSGERKLTVQTSPGEAGCVEVAVSDVGTGIPPERLPRLFDPFFSTKDEGMGLGLSIARSLVQAHGGRIRAENSRGAGATFRFELPASEELSHGAARARDSAVVGVTT
jgi:PAS domain S-box-containing protein